MEKRAVRDRVDMKLHNRRTVWELIGDTRPTSRAQLAKVTKMSPSSIARFVGELIDLGLLIEKPQLQTVIGRKATLLDINKDAFFTVGIHIDTDFVQVCLLDIENTPRSTMERKIRGWQMKQEEFADITHSMYKEMLATTGIPDAQVRTVGISVVGLVDQDNGITVFSPQLHWSNVPTRDVIAKKFKKPARLENDVKAAIVEEHTRYDEFKVGNIAYLTIGSGIGSAFMTNGSVLRGSNHSAGEIGHVTANPEGALCSCGRRGCFYTVLSEKALLKRIQELSGTAGSIDKWIRARREGEPCAVAIAGEFSRYIAMAINLLMSTYDPRTIIIGGSLISRQPEILGIVLDQEGYIQEPLRSNTKVINAKSNGQESVIGAAIVAKNHYLVSFINNADDLYKEFGKP